MTNSTEKQAGDLKEVLADIRKELTGTYTGDEIVEMIKGFLGTEMAIGVREMISDYVKITQALRKIVDNNDPTSKTAESYFEDISANFQLFCTTVLLVGKFTPPLNPDVGYFKPLPPSFKPVFEDFYAKMGDMKEAVAEYVRLVGTLKSLQPELDKEIQKAKYRGKDLDALYRDYEVKKSTDPKYAPGSKKLTLLEQAIKGAYQAKTNPLAQIEAIKKPKFITFSNTALENAMLGLDGKGQLIEGGPVDITTAYRGAKDGKRAVASSVYVNVVLENMTKEEKDIALKGSPWDLYDRAVCNAVLTLTIACREKGLIPKATPAQVYRVMTGMEEGEYVTPTAAAEVQQSIERQRNNLHLYADVTDDVKRHVKDLDRPFIIDGFMLQSKRMETRSRKKDAKGESAKVFVYYFDPVMLDYALITNKLLKFPVDFIRIREVKDGKVTDEDVANSKQRIAIRTYLISRLVQANNDFKNYRDALVTEQKRQLTAKKKGLITEQKPIHKPHSDVILFDTMLDGAGITGKNSRTNAKKYAKQVLEYWTAMGYVKGYSLRKKGKGYDAIVMNVKPLDGILQIPQSQTL